MIEQFPTDTVDYADIVLPATMQTEHLDVNDGYGHMYVHLNRPAVEPAGRVPVHDRDVPAARPRAWASTEPALYDDDETLAPHAARRRRLRAPATSEGWMRLDYPTPFVPFTDGFPTPSGKLEFFSETRGATATTRSPATRRPRRDRRRHPLALIAPAIHWFLNSMFANKPDLMKQRRRPADRAPPRRRGGRAASAPATTARVFNARGSFEAEVEVSDRVRPGVIASTKGYWLKHVRGGANVNATVEERDADMAGGAIFHDNRVEVERASVSGDALHQPRSQARVTSGRRAPAVRLRAR